MKVLLTNDDGIRAAGVRALYEALVERGHTVWLVAPMRQQSGVGHSLTVFEPLRSRRYADGAYAGIALYGTPTDCVKLGLSSIVPERPDLVMSGINLGPNTGPDILYSGTVGAATEACHADMPAMAVSDDEREGADLHAKALHAVSLAERIDWHSLPSWRVVNVNYPAGPLSASKGLRVCPQSMAFWKNGYERRMDPMGNPYWWIRGEIEGEKIGTGTDRDLLTRGYITVTPLCFDFIDRESLALLGTMHLEEDR